MASGLFFDPLVALRAAPLVSATCSLLYAHDQEQFLRIFGRPENRAASRPLLPGYFAAFFYRGTAVVVSFLAVTTGTSVANYYSTKPDPGSTWYLTGAVLAVSHLLFVPTIAPHCQTLVEAKPGDDNHKTLESWRAVNLVRALTVDLGAWLAIIAAVGKSLKA